MDSETAYIDWESSLEDYRCKVDGGDLPAGYEVDLSRESDFSLKGVVRFHTTEQSTLKSLPHIVDITGRTPTGLQTTIRNSLVRQVQRTKLGTSIHIEPQELSITYSNSSPVRVIEWLANFASNLLFPRSTETTISKKVERTYEDGRWSILNTTNATSHNRNYAQIKCHIGSKEIEFVLGTARRLDTSTRAGFIDYIDTGNGLPTEEEKELIRSGISFIFDLQLVMIGSTYFCSKTDVVRAEAIAGRYSGHPHLLQNAAEPPAPLHDQTMKYYLSEERLVSLLQKFIDHSHKHKLSRVILKLWDARTSTLDSRIARLVSTIEYLRSSCIGSKHELLPKKEWAKLLSVMQESLKNAANDLGISDGESLSHLINKLPGINFSSSVKQFDKFFNSLDLTISNSEKKALGIRNNQAHGIIYERANYQQLVQETRRVQILLNRVLLSIMKHDGSYNDHSRYPSIEVPIKDPPPEEIPTT